MGQNSISTTLKDRFSISHAFFVGIDDYDHLFPLQTAVSDVEAIAQLLEDSHGFKTGELLKNANYESIIHLVRKRMPNLVKNEDRVFFYFAGHGVAEVEEGEGPKGFILPRDASKEGQERYIPMTLLLEAFEQLDCRHFLLVLDCCFSGSIRWSSIHRRAATFDIIPRKIYRQRYDRFVRDPAWQVITSAAYDQEAIDIIHGNVLGRREGENTLHSPFAQRFMEGLKGKADLVPRGNPNGLITATELYLYLREGVEKESIFIKEELRQTPSFFPLKKHDKGEFVFLSPVHPLNLPEYRPRQNPYKGLQAYEYSETDNMDRELFYGRSRAIYSLLQKIESQSFTVVSGASGVGKSSLVNAGILPKMKDAGYEVLSIRPGSQPLEALAQVIFKEEFSQEKRYILYIDQFEELITRNSEEAARAKFLRRLYDLLDQQANYFKLLISVRSDFEPLFYDTVLGNLWKKSRYIVPPFTQDELREVIEQPAVQNVLHFDPPELVDTIINEVIQAPGALPLLSFTLSNVFERYINQGDVESSRALTHKAYEELGGVVGSLQNAVEKIYQELSTTQKEVMKKVMLRMVTTEGGKLVSRRVPLAELVYSNNKENERVQEVLKKLAGNRLVVLGTEDHTGIQYVEPAHEALIRAWGKLLVWVEEFRDISLRDIIISRVLEYERNHQFEEFLFHRDKRLDQLEEIRNSDNSWFNAKESTFIRKSIEIRGRKRKISKRNQFIIAIFLVSLSITSIGFGISNSQNAKLAFDNQIEAELQAKLATSNEERAVKEAQIAKQNEEEAIKQAQIAKQNLLSLLKANQKRVQSLVKEIDQDIFLLDFEKALQKIKIAVLIGQEKQAVNKRLFELAYFFNETRKHQRAVSLIDTIYWVLDGKNRPLNLPATLLEVRNELGNINQGWFDYLHFYKYYPTMIPVKGGRFSMGCDSSEYAEFRQEYSDVYKGQTVKHEIQSIKEVADFQISATEATVWQYFIYTQATGRPMPEIPRWGWVGNYPISGLTWYEALGYSNWVSAQLGYESAYNLSGFKKSVNELDNLEIDWPERLIPNADGMRLPTEIEWEYAARGGQKSEGYFFAGSNDAEEVAWYSSKVPKAVGQKKPNELGVFDMSGNMSEWCWDISDFVLFDVSGDQTNNFRVVRGGAVYNPPLFLRVSSRYQDSPMSRLSHGFRLARSWPK